MKTEPLKRIFLFCLVLIYFFNISGYYFIYEFNRFILKKEMNELIHHGAFSKDLSLVRIYKPQEHPEFTRDMNEFTFKGELYDIVREEHSGQVTTFWCIHDKKEQLLIGNMNRMHSNKHLLAMLHHLVTTALPVPRMVIPQNPVNNINYPFTIQFLNSTDILQPSPPPELS